MDEIFEHSTTNGVEGGYCSGDCWKYDCYCPGNYGGSWWDGLEVVIIGGGHGGIVSGSSDFMNWTWLIKAMQTSYRRMPTEVIHLHWDSFCLLFLKSELCKLNYWMVPVESEHNFVFIWIVHKPVNYKFNAKCMHLIDSVPSWRELVQRKKNKLKLNESWISR